MHKVINIFFFKGNKDHLNLNDTVNENYFSILTKFILHHSIFYSITLYINSVLIYHKEEKLQASRVIYVYTIMNVLLHVTIFL